MAWAERSTRSSRPNPVGIAHQRRYGAGGPVGEVTECGTFRTVKMRANWANDDL